MDTVQLVMSLPDILDELHHVLPELHRDHADHGQAVTRTTRLEPQEQTLLKHITGSGVSLEQLCQVSDWPPGRIAQTLITLELKGLVAALPGNRFARRYAADDGPKHEPSAG